MKPEIESFISHYLKELRSENAAIFVGSGLSKAAGFVDWAGLLAPFAKELGLDANKETNLVALAQYHLNANGANRNQLNQSLIDNFSDLPEPSESHRILSRLPIKTFWTTNYDRLIERALVDSGKRVDAKYSIQQLATTLRGRDAIVYKMHGDIERPDLAVLTKDDYEKYQTSHAPFITALSGNLVDHTFLFLGFSFTDPNLDYILSRIRTTFTNNQREHFCITKLRTKQADESDDAFKYEFIKQELITKDLLRFNIKTIFIEEYSDLPKILGTIERRYRRRTVFISGAAAEYGSWGRDKTENFVSNLGGVLISKDFRITSGFGLGIGGAIVTGSVQAIYSTNDKSIEDQLVLRPFPIGIKDDAKRTEVYDRYRNELIKQAGIAVFIMGNKLVDEKITNSDGMRIEYQKANEEGLFVIPVGASGYVAKELWDQTLEKFDEYFPEAPANVRNAFEQLGVPVENPNELISPLINIIELLAGE